MSFAHIWHNGKVAGLAIFREVYQALKSRGCRKAQKWSVNFALSKTLKYFKFSIEDEAQRTSATELLFFQWVALSCAHSTLQDNIFNFHPNSLFFDQNVVELKSGFMVVNGQNFFGLCNNQFPKYHLRDASFPFFFQVHQKFYAWFKIESEQLLLLV